LRSLLLGTGVDDLHASPRIFEQHLAKGRLLVEHHVRDVLLFSNRLEQEDVIFTSEVFLRECNQVVHVRFGPGVLTSVRSDLGEKRNNSIMVEVLDLLLHLAPALEDVLSRHDLGVILHELGEINRRRMTNERSHKLEEDVRRTFTCHVHRRNSCGLKTLVNLFPRARRGVCGQRFELVEIREAKCSVVMANVVHKDGINTRITGPLDPIFDIGKIVEDCEAVDERRIHLVDGIVAATVDTCKDASFIVKRQTVELAIKNDLECTVHDLLGRAIELVEQEDVRSIASGLEPVDRDEASNIIGHLGQTDHIAFGHLCKTTIDVRQRKVLCNLASDLRLANAVWADDQYGLIRRKGLQDGNKVSGIDGRSAVSHVSSPVLVSSSVVFSSYTGSFNNRNQSLKVFYNLGVI
jgi:hypothetical protein